MAISLPFWIVSTSENFRKDTRSLIDGIRNVSSEQIVPTVYAIVKSEADRTMHNSAEIKYSFIRHVEQDYAIVADDINSNNIGLTILQHEFGLYGGAFGQLILKTTVFPRIPFWTDVQKSNPEPRIQDYVT